MVNFGTWLFNLFPYRFREEDTYKDGDGKGLLERYMQALGEELDEEVIPPISLIAELNDPELVSDKHLVHLADFLGNPPHTFGDDTKYRKLLKYLVKINQHKGTEEGYKLIFGVLGVDVTITEVEPTSNIYDDTLEYDSGNIYDSNCPPCSKYSLAIEDPDGNCPEIGDAESDPVLYALLRKIIEYVEPINAMMTNLTYNGDVTGDRWVLTTGIWADQNYWNDAKYWRDEP